MLQLHIEVEIVDDYPTRLKKPTVIQHKITSKQTLTL